MVVGNLVAVWRKLRCGDKNIFSCGRNNLSMSTETNSVKEKEKVAEKGWQRWGKINPFVRRSPLPRSTFLSLGLWLSTDLCSFYQQEVGPFFSKRGNIWSFRFITDSLYSPVTSEILSQYFVMVFMQIEVHKVSKYTSACSKDIEMQVKIPLQSLQRKHSTLR